MARPLRVEYEGALYHLTARGNSRKDIFHTESDRQHFLNTLHAVIRRYQWVCHAYCLMNNHYHLLIETPEGNLSVGMRQLNGVYTQDRNRRDSTTGHLLEGRFKSIIVDKDSYLLELSRYIVLNPVRANLVALPEQWKWSSYLATAGFAATPPCLTVSYLLSMFSEDRAKSHLRYRRYVMEGIQVGFRLNPRGRLFVGKDTFSSAIEPLLEETQTNKNYIKAQRYATRPDLSRLLLPTDNKHERNKRMAIAHNTYGYTLQEIGDFLGVHYSTVFKAVKSLENTNSKNKT